MLRFGNFHMGNEEKSAQALWITGSVVALMCLVVAYYVMNPVPWASRGTAGPECDSCEFILVKCDCGFKKNQLISFHWVKCEVVHLWHHHTTIVCAAGVYSLIGTSLCVLLSGRKKLTHSGDFSSGVHSSNSRRRTSPSVKNKQRIFPTFEAFQIRKCDEHSFFVSSLTSETTDWRYIFSEKYKASQNFWFLPSRELTYPLLKALLTRWFSFSRLVGYVI